MPIGTVFSRSLWVSAPLYAMSATEFRIRYRGRMRWVRRSDWDLRGMA